MRGNDHVICDVLKAKITEISKIAVKYFERNDDLKKKYGLIDVHGDKVPFDSLKDVDLFDIAKSFTFLLFRTILIYPQQMTKEHILLHPIYDSSNERLGTFVGIFNQKPSDENLKKVNLFFDYLLILISLFELNSKNKSTANTILTVEDNVRKCSRIAPHNNASDEIPDFFKPFQVYNKDDLRVAVPNSHKKLEEGVIKFLSEFLGTNEKFKSVLKSIQSNILLNEGKTNSILLYSEPGNGKEKIAPLCHLFSKKWLSTKPIKQPNWSKIEKSFKDRLKDFYELNATGDEICFNIGSKELISMKTIAPYNFFTVFCNLLSKENIQELLFGQQTAENNIKLGEFFIAHLTCGTVFFDEFNTLKPPEVSSIFLRTLDKPNSIIIKNSPLDISEINVLAIFASNLSPEELIKEGFNDALISRMRAYRIPPLRERPEDIPILLNYFIWKIKNDAIKKDDFKDYVAVTEIDKNGLHILSRLPWKENIRELKRFADDLISYRIHRKIITNEISFEEIMRCIIEIKKFS